MEEGGNRWSKPHVATLSLHSLFELRSLLLHGALLLDMEATSMESVADMILDNLVNADALPEEARDKVGAWWLVWASLRNTSYPSHLTSSEYQKPPK